LSRTARLQEFVFASKRGECSVLYFTFIIFFLITLIEKIRELLQVREVGGLKNFYRFWSSFYPYFSLPI